MKTDKLGIPRFSDQDLIDMIYSGHIDKCHVVLCEDSDDVNKFNTYANENGLSPLTKYIPLDVDEKTFDGVCQSEWFMPDEYKNDCSIQAYWNYYIGEKHVVAHESETIYKTRPNE